MGFRFSKYLIFLTLRLFFINISECQVVGIDGGVAPGAGNDTVDNKTVKHDNFRGFSTPQFQTTTDRSPRVKGREFAKSHETDGVNSTDPGSSETFKEFLAANQNPKTKTGQGKSTDSGSSANSTDSVQTTIKPNKGEIKSSDPGSSESMKEFLETNKNPLTGTDMVKNSDPGSSQGVKDLGDPNLKQQTGRMQSRNPESSEYFKDITEPNRKSKLNDTNDLGSSRNGTDITEPGNDNAIKVKTSDPGSSEYFKEIAEPSRKSKPNDTNVPGSSEYLSDIVEPKRTTNAVRVNSSDLGSSEYFKDITEPKPNSTPVKSTDTGSLGDVSDIVEAKNKLNGVRVKSSDPGSQRNGIRSTQQHCKMPPKMCFNDRMLKIQQKIEKYELNQQLVVLMITKLLDK